MLDQVKTEAARTNLAPIPMECDAPFLKVTGELPRELNGTLYRNGPNPQFDAPGAHWFLGDGMVHGIEISESSVRFARENAAANNISNATFTAGDAAAIFAGFEAFALEEVSDNFVDASGLHTVDSPGGEVLASDDISRALLQFQENYDKPVIASMGGLAASGGYYISAPCRWIVANELTITGSIGVIMSTFNYRQLLDKVGVRPTVFKSGKFKDMLRGSKRLDEIDPAEEQMIQDMVMETFQKFKTVVREGRARAHELNDDKGKALVEDWEEYADGRILTGKTAYELGFVDQIGNFQTAVNTAKRIAGIEKAHLIRYQEPFNISHLFSLSAKAEEKVIKIDLGIDLPKLEAGRLYFLSPTVLH